MSTTRMSRGILLTAAFGLAVTSVTCGQVLPERLPETTDGTSLRRQLQPLERLPIAKVGEIPPEYHPWWVPQLTQPLLRTEQTQPVDVTFLIFGALRYSPRVRAISENVLIRRTAIVEADAEFDVHAFMESKFVRTSLPTGSTLEAGANVPRLREEDWQHTAGLRRKNEYGGTVELAQRFGLRDSNSTFFQPVDQGNSRLTLNYTQPILNGYGKAYNRSLIVLAQLDSRAAWDRTSRDLQDHLLSVTEAHWQLYRERAALLQKQRHLLRAVKISEELEARRDVDAMSSQIARARAAVATRQTDLIRATAMIQNTEARIRALVNDPNLAANRDIELIPQLPPVRNFIPVEIEDVMVTALANRPEIDEATQEVRAASVRLQMAERELLPILDLIVETYVTGLRGNYDIADAFADQFQRGEPSYTAGFLLEVPLHNRAARARFERRRLEVRQLTSQFQSTIAMLKAEVEVAVRDVSTAFREMQSRYHAMLAAADDAGYLERRWELLPGEDRAASFLLEDLLDAQDRLAGEEFNFVKAQTDYTVSLARLNRATGTLLQKENVIHHQTKADCLPRINFDLVVPPPDR